jgi:hypothetical protein
MPGWTPTLTTTFRGWRIANSVSIEPQVKSLGPVLKPIAVQFRNGIEVVVGQPTKTLRAIWIRGPGVAKFNSPFQKQSLQHFLGLPENHLRVLNSRSLVLKSELFGVFNQDSLERDSSNVRQVGEVLSPSICSPCCFQLNDVIA